MSGRGIPDRVRRFVSAHIHSVEEMDILLLLRQHRDRDWSADEVAKELRSAPHSASMCARNAGSPPPGSPPTKIFLMPNSLGSRPSLRTYSAR